jgi:hypothetical protein
MSAPFKSSLYVISIFRFCILAENKILQEVGCGGMGWFDLAQDKDRWRSLENAIMNLRFP